VYGRLHELVDDQREEDYLSSRRRRGVSTSVDIEARRAATGGSENDLRPP